MVNVLHALSVLFQSNPKSLPVNQYDLDSRFGVAPIFIMAVVFEM